MDKDKRNGFLQLSERCSACGRVIRITTSQVKERLLCNRSHGLGTNDCQPSVRRAPGSRDVTRRYDSAAALTNRWVVHGGYISKLMGLVRTDPTLSRQLGLCSPVQSHWPLRRQCDSRQEVYGTAKLPVRYQPAFCQTSRSRVREDLRVHNGKICFPLCRTQTERKRYNCKPDVNKSQR